MCEVDCHPGPQLLNPFFSALCHSSEKVRWHAVAGFGQVVNRIYKEDIEAARVVMRRFLWSLNDESGGVGWGAPEAMAEVMCRNEGLRQEYLHMLISYMREDGEELFQDGNFLELPLLQRGLLWGICRLASLFPEELEKYKIENDLLNYRQSQDPLVRFLALGVLSLLGGGQETKLEEWQLGENDTFCIFWDGVFQNFQVGDFLRRRLA